MHRISDSIDFNEGIFNSFLPTVKKLEGKKKSKMLDRIMPSSYQSAIDEEFENRKILLMPDMAALYKEEMEMQEDFMQEKIAG
jgi:hypothetical protein